MNRSYLSTSEFPHTILNILQLLFILLLFPVFTFAVNPAGLAEALPPGTDYYIYLLWPKQAVLAGLFSIALLGSGITLYLGELTKEKNKYLKALTLVVVVFLITHVLSILPGKGHYLSDYEIWQGEIIYGDGLLWTGMWWLLLPLAATLFSTIRVHLSTVIYIMLASVTAACAWAVANRMGFEPASLINPNMRVLDVRAGFGNRAWAGFIFGIYYIVFLVTAVNRKLSGVALLGLLISAFSITITGGRIGILTPIVCTLLLVLIHFYRKQPLRTYIAPVLVTLVAASLSYGTGFAKQDRLTGLTRPTTDGGFTHRTIPWTAGLRVIAKHPLTGEHSTRTGQLVWENLNPAETQELLTEFAPREIIQSGNYEFIKGTLITRDEKTKQVEVSNVQFSKFHNQFIELTVRGGIFILSVYLVLLTLIFFKAIQLRNMFGDMAAATVVAYSLFNMTWFTGPIVETFVLALIGSLLGVGLSSQKSSALKSDAA